MGASAGTIDHFNSIIDPLSQLVPDASRPAQRGYLYIEHPDDPSQRRLVVVQQKPADQKLDTIFNYIRWQVVLGHDYRIDRPRGRNTIYDLVPIYQNQFRLINEKTTALYENYLNKCPWYLKSDRFYSYYNKRPPWYFWILRLLFRPFYSPQIDKAYRTFKSDMTREINDLSSTAEMMEKADRNSKQACKQIVAKIKNRLPKTNIHTFQTLRDTELLESFSKTVESEKQKVRSVNEALPIRMIPARKIGPRDIPAHIHNKKQLLNHTGEITLQLKDLTDESIPLLQSLFDENTPKTKLLTIKATGKTPITSEQQTFLTHLREIFEEKGIQIQMNFEKKPIDLPKAREIGGAAPSNEKTRKLGQKP